MFAAMEVVGSERDSKDVVLLRQGDITRRVAHEKQSFRVHGTSLFVERCAIASLYDVLKDGTGDNFPQGKY